MAKRLRVVMLKGFYLFMMMFVVGSAEASLLEIEKQCSIMYKDKVAVKKIKNLCFCITINIRDRFSNDQIEDLTQIYAKRTSRYEASKNDTLKAMTEFDYFTHTNCLKNPLWRFPKDDIGHPDEL